MPPLRYPLTRLLAGEPVQVLCIGGGRGPKGGKSPRSALIRYADGHLEVRPARGLRRPRAGEDYDDRVEAPRG